MANKKTSKVYKPYLKEMTYCSGFCATYALKIIADESISLTKEGNKLLAEVYDHSRNLFEALDDFMVAENLHDKRKKKNA